MNNTSGQRIRLHVGAIGVTSCDEVITFALYSQYNVEDGEFRIGIKESKGECIQVVQDLM